jgi:hypothetical protein
LQATLPFSAIPFGDKFVLGEKRSMIETAADEASGPSPALQRKLSIHGYARQFILGHSRMRVARINSCLRISDKSKPTLPGVVPR